MPGDGKNAEQWSSANKFSVVLETASLNQAELAQYCRSKGLYIEQITAWEVLVWMPTLTLKNKRKLLPLKQKKTKTDQSTRERMA